MLEATRLRGLVLGHQSLVLPAGRLPGLPLLPLGPARVEQVPRLHQAVADGATQRVVAVEHAPGRLQ